MFCNGKLQIILQHVNKHSTYRWDDLSLRIMSRRTFENETIETLHVIPSFYRNSVFTKAIEAKKRSYEGSNLVNRVNWVNEFNRAGNTEHLLAERERRQRDEGWREGTARQGKRARNLSFRSWSAVVATRLKLQYLGVEWRLERRGMEWRLEERKSDRNRGQEGGRLRREYLDVEKDGGEGEGKSAELGEREREAELLESAMECHWREEYSTETSCDRKRRFSGSHSRHPFPRVFANHPLSMFLSFALSALLTVVASRF